MKKLQEIRDALDDDAVFNVVGEVLPAAHVERVLRDYYAGKLGDADLEDRLLRDVDEGQFRAICQNALEGLAIQEAEPRNAGGAPGAGAGASRRARDHRAVPARGGRVRASLDPKPVARPPAHFRPGPDADASFASTSGTRTGGCPPWRTGIPRCSTDREAAEKDKLEWVTPGHPLFEAVRRHTRTARRRRARQGRSFYSLRHEQPARMDFFRARIVDGLGNIVHERLFAVELTERR